ESSSRTSSASRDSESVVKPTRSAKRTETRRRSAAAVVTGAAAPWSAAPHSPQNFSPPAIPAPQDGHACASAVPHSVQNFLPSWFSARQLGHTIVVRRAYWLDEPVAHPGLGEDVGRSRGVGLDLAAQVGDVDVEVVRLAAVGRAPDALE